MPRKSHEHNVDRLGQSYKSHRSPNYVHFAICEEKERKLLVRRM